MQYARRLNLANPMLDLDRNAPVLGRHGKGIHFPVERVIRRYITKDKVRAVQKLLPASLRGKPLGTNLSEIRILGPHIHVREQCVINFYEETHGEVTTFWEGEVVPDDRWSQDNGNGYYHVNHELLKPVEEFIAQPGDVWFLNTSQPHSVTYPGDTRTDGYQFLPVNMNARYIMQVYFDMPFEEILPALEDAGLITD